MSERKIWPRRYVLVALCFIATFICYMDRVNISVAVIALQQEFDWSNTVKGFVLSSFFVGYLVMQVPAGIIANKLGGKIVLGFAVVWWSVFTMLTPAAASLSLIALIIVRMALGLGEAATFPAVFSLYKNWVPAKERSRAVTLTLSGAHLGTLAALLLTGWVVDTFGWPMVFYLFGPLGFFWAIAWYFTVDGHPTTSKGISREEEALLAPLHADKKALSSVPWKSLLTEPAVYSLVISHFSANWVMYMLVAWMPSYFHATQGVSITGAALYSAAPYLTAFVVANISGSYADWLLTRGWSATAVRKLMQSIGLLGSAVFLLLARDVGSASEALAYMCAALGLLTFTFSGTASATLEIAPRYSDVLSGISNTAGTLPGIIAVVITGWLVDVTGSYDAALALTAMVSVIGAAVWLIFGTAKNILDEASPLASRDTNS